MRETEKDNMDPMSTTPQNIKWFDLADIYLFIVPAVYMYTYLIGLAKTLRNIYYNYVKLYAKPVAPFGKSILELVYHHIFMGSKGHQAAY